MEFSTGITIYTTVFVTIFLLTMGLEMPSCSRVLAPKSTPSEVKLEAGDNGKEFELKKDQKLVITLESTPTTGFTWEVAELDEDILHLVSKEYKQKSVESVEPMEGVGGAEIFRFEAVNAGKTILKLVYHRPWLEDVESAKTFSIRVVVDK